MVTSGIFTAQLVYGLITMNTGCSNLPVDTNWTLIGKSGVISHETLPFQAVKATDATEIQTGLFR